MESKRLLIVHVAWYYIVSIIFITLNTLTCVAVFDNKFITGTARVALFSITGIFLLLYTYFLLNFINLIRSTRRYLNIASGENFLHDINVLASDPSTHLIIRVYIWELIEINKRYAVENALHVQQDSEILSQLKDDAKPGEEKTDE